MVERFTAGVSDKGRRLDQFIADNADALSRTKARKIIDIGGVHVGGRRVRKAGLILDAGQRIELFRDNGPLDPFRLNDDLVVFQDQWIIVINKPSGVETQPTPARYRGTLYEALQLFLKRDRRFGRRLEIGMAQRLDRDTSGLIVFSIHPQAHKGLTEQMQSRSAEKVYHALVAGRLQPPAGVYRSQLRRDRRSGLMRSVDEGGKEAITAYRVEETLPEPIEISRVELVLVTGRTHQIRAHLAEAGHPLLGDVRYGGISEIGGHRFDRHCLHSSHLQLVHPKTGKPVKFSAPLPDDMVMDRFVAG